MATVTICTDSDGRITALVVPEGACATVIEADVEDAFAARFGGDGERVFQYDANRDAGLREEVPRGYRSRMGFTIHGLEDEQRRNRALIKNGPAR